MHWWMVKCKDVTFILKSVSDIERSEIAYSQKLELDYQIQLGDNLPLFTIEVTTGGGRRQEHN